MPQGATAVGAHLRAAGADPNAMSYHGETPLQSAIRTDGVEVVSALLEAEFDPNATDDTERTPLHYAARRPPKRIAPAHLSDDDGSM